MLGSPVMNWQSHLPKLEQHPPTKVPSYCKAKTHPLLHLDKISLQQISLLPDFLGFFNEAGPSQSCPL